MAEVGEGRVTAATLPAPLGQTVGVGEDEHTERVAAVDAHAEDVDLAAVLRALPDGVVVIDHLAQVLWINARFTELTGWQLEEVRGRNGLDLIDPVQQLDAIEALSIVREAPNAIPPGAYRLQHRDGGFVPLEMHAASIDPDDEGSVTVLLARPVDYQTLMVDGLELLNGDGPIEVMADYIVNGIGFRSGAMTLVFDDDVTGERRSVHPNLPEVLDGSHKAEDGRAPWEETEATGAATQARVDALPPSLQAAARACGFVSCSVDTIPDPGGRDALVILWFAEDAPVNYRFLFKEEPRYLLFRLALERRAYHEALLIAATQDHLTGLANRARFFETIEGARPEPDAIGGRTAVLYIDLDDFKPVNDVHGHLAGDAVLAEVGRRIRAIVRPTDLVARVGGDEFAVFCPDVADEAAVEALAARIHAVVVLPIPLAGDQGDDAGEDADGDEGDGEGDDAGAVEREADGGGAALVGHRATDRRATTVRVGASIGAAVARDPAIDPAQLVGAADELLYELKRAGKDGWRVRTVGAERPGDVAPRQ